MVEAVIKRIDKLGRIVIPAPWREKLGDLVLLIRENDKTLRIISLKDFKLTDLFDSIEVSLDAREWIDVKKMRRGIIDEISGF